MTAGPAPVVCLTFDNGPTPGTTEAVLDVLAEHGVHATFFAIGRKLATASGRRLGQRIVESGHQLGGHTWTHSMQSVLPTMTWSTTSWRGHAWPSMPSAEMVC